MPAMTLPKSTAALALSAALATTAYLVLSVQISAAYIAEDAAILMRYAHHLGAGLGFVWNPGEPPVDGATDWLGTTLLGGLYALGVSLELGPRLLAGAAQIGTVALAVLIMRAALGAPLVPTLVSIAFVVLGPASAYVQSGFLAPLFALTVL